MNNGGAWYIGIAWIVGLIAGLGIWLYAILTWGLLIGLIIGWLPGAIGGFVLGLLWPITLIGGLFLYNAVFPKPTPSVNAPQTTTSVSPSTNSDAQTAPSVDTSTQAPTVSSPSQSVGTLPTVVGACDSTTVTQVGTRLTDGTTGDPIPGSGSAINYADGGYQVSYDTEPSVQDWQVGDPIDLCFVSAPTDCPAGDDRGIVYQATNERTGETWTAQNSEHSCGGA